MKKTLDSWLETTVLAGGSPVCLGGSPPIRPPGRCSWARRGGTVTLLPAKMPSRGGQVVALAPGAEV
jgi:hypothetical protein